MKLFAGMPARFLWRCLSGCEGICFRGLSMALSLNVIARMSGRVFLRLCRPPRCIDRKQVIGPSAPVAGRCGRFFERIEQNCQWAMALHRQVGRFCTCSLAFRTFRQRSISSRLHPDNMILSSVLRWGAGSPNAHCRGLFSLPRDQRASAPKDPLAGMDKQAMVSQKLKRFSLFGFRWWQWSSASASRGNGGPSLEPDLAAYRKQRRLAIRLAYA